MVNRVYAMNGQLLYERDLTTNRVTQHVYFDGKPIAMIRNGVRSYVPTDHLGRPELLVDDTAAANTVWKATLGPFDRERITVDTIGGYHLGFPGQYHDQETGFAYNINRDYDPSTGRYLQPDPIGLMGGANRYGYAGQSPVMMVDPFGLYDYPQSHWRRLTEIHSAQMQVGMINAWRVNAIASESLIAAQSSGLPGLRNGPADAFRHCFWSCSMAKAIGHFNATLVGDNHERYGDNPQCEIDMDLQNNRAGVDIGKAKGNCQNACMGKALSGQLSILPTPSWSRP
jgi:RHS repeat-associated protein